MEFNHCKYYIDQSGYLYSGKSYIYVFITCKPATLVNSVDVQLLKGNYQQSIHDNPIVR